MTQPGTDSPTSPRIVALANQKGGVGKTTVTLDLGAALQELGRTVLIVDLDPQASATRVLGVDVTSTPTMADLMLAEHDRHAITEVVQPTSWGVALAPSEIALARIERQRKLGDEFVLREALDGLSAYDTVLIDCPPQLGILAVNALIAATDLLIVTEPSYMALQGIGDLLDTAELIRRRYNPGLQLTGVIVNLVDNTREAAVRLTELQGFFQDGEVWEPVIPRRALIREAIARGVPLTAPAAPRDADAIAQVFTELAGRL